MWSDKYDPEQEGRPLPRDPYAEVPPGRPPWAPGISPAGIVFLGLLGAGAVAVVVNTAVLLWRLVDRAADLSR